MWWPSEPPRLRIERRVDSTSLPRYTWLAAACPASWMATARVSSWMYSMFWAVPVSTVVIASTMSRHANSRRPSVWAMVRAIEQHCSIIDGE